MDFIGNETHFLRILPPPKITNVDERLSITTAEFKITKYKGFTNLFYETHLKCKNSKDEKNQTS